MSNRPGEEEGGNPTALVIPAGYALVPLEPTPEMIAAMAVVEMSGTINGQPSIGMSGAAEAYAAMIKAAPGEIDRIGTSITIDYKQATELLEMFAGEPCGVTLNIGDGHSGNGLYAWWEAVPEEGALFLGVYDEEAAPGAAHSCWSCEAPVTAEERTAADGHCPHCGVELDDELWPARAAQAQGGNDA